MIQRFFSIVFFLFIYYIDFLPTRHIIIFGTSIIMGNCKSNENKIKNETMYNIYMI